MIRLLFAAFLVVPLVEIYLIVQIGQQIGPAPTVLLLLADSLLGAWLVKREGMRTWRALRSRLGSTRLPGDELADGALVLIGGTLLLTPGFVTDVAGFLLILPFTRPFARRLLLRTAMRQAVRSVSRPPASGRRQGRVVDVEVARPHDEP
ncbi:MAG: FxsA family protein [Actinomycetota bacterium]|nr:FxsA family protein [Actinomycetota bacterium]